MDNPSKIINASGTGFNLLACIIEKISGTSYRDYMSDKVFKPLGMSHSMVANFPSPMGKVPNHASGFIYDKKLNKYQRADSLYLDWNFYFSGVTGEGMIVTTAEDLLKWDRALQNNKLLSAATQNEMLTIQAIKKTFPFVQFGFGMRVGENQLGDYHFHIGWFPGYKSMHIHYTAGDITVIVLSYNESQSEFVADGLATIASGKDIVQISVHKEALKNEPFAQYTRKYFMALTLPPYMTNFPVEILEKNNVLSIHPFRGEDIELKIESDNKFYFGNGTDQQIIFQKDSNENIEKIWHVAWGVKKEIKRI